MTATSVALGRFVRAVTVMTVVVTAFLTPSPSQAAEKTVETPGTFSVTRLVLQSDGSVRVAARLKCNTPSTEGVLWVGVGLEQHERLSGDGGAMPCTGRPQHLTFDIPAPAEGRFRAGEAVLYPSARMECPSPGPSDPDDPSDTGGTVLCSPGFDVSGTILVTLVPKKPAFVGPQINVSGLRLTPDGTIVLYATFICGRETVGLGGQVEQGEASGWFALDTSLCTGRWQRQQVIVVSDTGVPFRTGSTSFWAGANGHEYQQDEFTNYRSLMYSTQYLTL